MGLTLLFAVFLLSLGPSATANLLPVDVTTVLQHLSLGDGITSYLMDPNGDLYITLASAVYWMDYTSATPGLELIVGDPNSILYAEGQGSSASFFSPQALKYFNGTHLLVADRSLGCIRTIDLDTNTTAIYAGNCTVPGETDGHRVDEALFTYPADMVLLGQLLYVVDYITSHLRVIDNSNDQVTTLAQGGVIAQPLGLIACDANILYMTTFHGIVQYIVDTNETNLIAGNSSAGNADGSLSQSRFNQPYSINLLTNQLFLVADYGNAQLKIVDIQNDVVTSIGSGTQGSNDGDASTTTFNFPFLAYVYDEDILVSDQGKVRKLPLYSVIEATAPPLSCRTDLTTTTQLPTTTTTAAPTTTTTPPSTTTTTPPPTTTTRSSTTPTIPTTTTPQPSTATITQPLTTTTTTIPNTTEQLPTKTALPCIPGGLKEEDKIIIAFVVVIIVIVAVLIIIFLVLFWKSGNKVKPKVDAEVQTTDDPAHHSTGYNASAYRPDANTAHFITKTNNTHYPHSEPNFSPVNAQRNAKYTEYSSSDVAENETKMTTIPQYKQQPMPPLQAEPKTDSGLAPLQAKPKTDSGLAPLQAKPKTDSGLAPLQAKPRTDSGLAPLQAKPRTDTGLRQNV